MSRYYSYAPILSHDASGGVHTQGVQEFVFKATGEIRIMRNEVSAMKIENLSLELISMDVYLRIIFIKKIYI